MSGASTVCVLREWTSKMPTSWCSVSSENLGITQDPGQNRHNTQEFILIWTSAVGNFSSWTALTHRCLDHKMTEKSISEVGNVTGTQNLSIKVSIQRCNSHSRLLGYLNCGFTIVWENDLYIENKTLPTASLFPKPNEWSLHGRACSCFHFDYNHLYHNLSQTAHCLHISYSYKLPQHDKDFHMKQKDDTSHHSNLSIFTAVCGTILFNAAAFILPLQLGITWLRVLRKFK